MIPQTCVILAGGLGTRLRSIIQDRPKCLAPVGGRTFLDWQMAALSDAGVTEIVLSLGYGADQVLESVKQNPPPLPLRYVIEQQPLGTGGAIAFSMDVFALDEVLVANGDTYLSGDVSQMLPPLDRASNELFRVAAVTVANRDRFGGIVTDSSNRIRGFLEKGQSGSGLINAGLYRLCRDALPAGCACAYSLESEVLPMLVSSGRVTARTILGSFIDIGVPEDYRVFCNRYAS
jgi:D-glycero-alpha-D-manno-heptose 1-phosphate guanylyltransferase